MNVLAYVHLRNIHHSTGAGRVARQLVEHVARRDGVNLHILGDRADYRAVVPSVGRPWTTFPNHLFSSDTSVQQARWLMLQRPTAEQYWSEVQIVHCTTESYVPTAGARLVVTVHDAAYFDAGAHPNNFSTMRQEVKWRTLYGTLSRTVDAFHTVSNFSAERLATAFPAIRSRMRVIHNAVSPIFLEPFDSTTEEMLEVAGLKGRRYILVPGGLHYRKNADLVLKAWPIIRERNPDAMLVVAGHNDPAYLPHAASLGESLSLVGFVEDPLLRALYHGAHAVWFPSRYEGFGIPVLEAMACGAPVVASNSAAIPEVAGDAAILVESGSLAENVEAIDTVINTGELRMSLRRRGKARAEPFTWAAAAVKLHKVYASLL
jgi:glycosyltransferase involved in cell wall biosynthesis